MGWKPDADTQYSNHNNYVVSTILSLGWPRMPSARKDEARAESAGMLDWCLTEAVDGSVFKNSEDSDLDAYYFGVRFLDRVGFWDRSKRLWSRRNPAYRRGANPIRSLSPATAWLRAPQRQLGKGRNRLLLGCHCSVHDCVYRLAGLNGVGTS
jgi:hypothetical protein